MKTIKLKIKNEVNLTKELKEFNSLVRYSFNRFQEGLKEKEVREKVNKLFKNNCWFNQCGIKVGQQLYKKHKDKKERKKKRNKDYYQRNKDRNITEAAKTRESNRCIIELLIDRPVKEIAQYCKLSVSSIYRIRKEILAEQSK